MLGFNDKGRRIIQAMNIVRNEIDMFPKWQHGFIKLKNGTEICLTKDNIRIEYDQIKIGFFTHMGPFLIEHYTHRKHRAVLHIYSGEPNDVEIPHDEIDSIYVFTPNEIDLEILFDSRD